jgi:hypothetical protein
MRMLTDEMDVYTGEPHNDLLQNRSWNEAYCMANSGCEYAVFFPDGGNVLLDVSAVSGQSLSVRWLDIRRPAWTGAALPVQMRDDGLVPLITPTEEGYWAALVQAES